MYVERGLRKYFTVDSNSISLHGVTVANNIKIYLKDKLIEENKEYFWPISTTRKYILIYVFIYKSILYILLIIFNVYAVIIDN